MCESAPGSAHPARFTNGSRAQVQPLTERRRLTCRPRTQPPGASCSMESSSASRRPSPSVTSSSDFHLVMQKLACGQAHGDRARSAALHRGVCIWSACPPHRMCAIYASAGRGRARPAGAASGSCQRPRAGRAGPGVTPLGPAARRRARNRARGGAHPATREEGYHARRTSAPPQIADPRRTRSGRSGRRRSGATAATDVRHRRPVLLFMGLVGDPAIFDLHPGNSWAQRLVDEGFDVFLFDWGKPEAAEGDHTLDTYLTWLPRPRHSRRTPRGGRQGRVPGRLLHGGADGAAAAGQQLAACQRATSCCSLRPATTTTRQASSATTVRTARPGPSDRRHDGTGAGGRHARHVPPAGPHVRRRPVRHAVGEPVARRLRGVSSGGQPLGLEPPADGRTRRSSR